MKVAFLSSYDPTSTGSWSGTPYYMLSALKRHNIDVKVLGPINSLTKPFLKAFKLFLKLFGINYDYSYSSILSYEYAFRFNKILKKISDVDFIIAPAGSTQIAHLKTNIPILYLSDTTYDQLKKYYSNFNSINDSFHYQGSKIERAALNNAAIVSFPSDWAAEFCVKHYKLPESKVKKLLWGANIVEPNAHPKIRTQDGDKSFTLLFLGVDWERKGGKVALEAVEYLRKSKNIDAKLIVCGCTPETSELPDWVEVTGRLNKDIPSDMTIFKNVLMKSDVLLLPTIAECYGMVFCEAAAYGMPVVATNTGGISSIVVEGETGLLIDDPTDSQAFANSIYEIINNFDSYNRYSNNAFERYHSHLNWDAWAKKIIELMYDYK